MTRPLTRLTVAVLAAALTGTAARADFQATFTNTSPGLQINNLTAGTTTYGAVNAGLMNFTNSTGADQGFGPNFATFCAELDRAILHYPTASHFSTPAPLASTVGTTTANYLSELWGRYYSQTGTNLGAAAFQLAVWELITDPTNNLNVFSGNLRITDDPGNNHDAGTLANQWLGTLSGDASQLHGGSLVALQSSDSQGQIGMQPVPAPAGLILGLVGLTALAARRVYGRRAAA